MPDQEEQRKVSELAKDAMLFGTRLGVALASGQPWVIVDVMANLADQHAERLKHIGQKVDEIQQKVDKIHTNVLTLLYTEYKTGHDFLRVAYETKGRKERRERFKIALHSFVNARQNVLLPLETVDAILHIGICHLLLGEEELARRFFAEARTELQNLQATLDSNSNRRFTSIDGTLVEMQSLPTRLRRTLRADESKLMASQFNPDIALIEWLERLKLPSKPRVKITGTALATTVVALGGGALYFLRRHWRNSR